MVLDFGNRASGDFRISKSYELICFQTITSGHMEADWGGKNIELNQLI